MTGAVCSAFRILLRCVMHTKQIPVYEMYQRTCIGVRTNSPAGKFVASRTVANSQLSNPKAGELPCVKLSNTLNCVRVKDVIQDAGTLPWGVR